MAELKELLTLLAPVSESSLRRLLRESGAALSPEAAGVDQSDFDALAATLSQLAEAYEGGDADRRQLCRSIVITAKDHARLASRNRRMPESAREEKSEMVRWMLLWLENPPAFPLWASLRASRGAADREAY
jgi:hypothetical protein